MNIVVPIAMIVVGAVVYAVARGGSRTAEVGRLILLAGLFAFAFANAGKIVF